MAELVRCGSCGGAFRHDPPPRRALVGEMHDGGDPVAPRCHQCRREPQPTWRAHVQQPIERSVADFTREILERSEARRG